MKAAHALLIYAALSLLSSSCVRANSDRKVGFHKNPIRSTMRGNAVFYTIVSQTQI